MHEVTLSVLGRMAARVNGADVSLGGPRQRAVLASVLLASPRSVSMTRIVDDVWDGEDPPTQTTVHAYIAELRRALEPGRKARQAATVLVTEGTGYALRLPPDAIDSTAFARLAGEGAQALRDGDPARAEELLRAALDLWRGPAFADFPDAGFVASEVRRLESLRETAHQDLAEAGLALGRHPELVGELAAYTDRHPMAERGWELLALALYRCGLQADALAAIRRATALLADELGLDVGPSLRRMETAILRQDPALELAAPESRAQSNLPFPVTDFVGRAGPLGDLSTLLGRARLVTVTGPGGVGKTRLALEAGQAQRSPDGPWFVDLAGLRQPELVAATVAEALGVPGVATAQRLAAVLGSRRILLILDNCEHLVDAVRELCVTVLSGCGAVRVLATSRESLGITGEAVLELGPMGEDGPDLFVRRAEAVQPHWRPQAADRPLIERICAELDGLPLAIELAAAQLRVLSLDQVAASVGERSGMATAIAWSYDLLEPAERELFGRLSPFAGGFDLDSASTVAGRQSILEPLSGLVRKSLLQVEHATTPRRYRMLVTVRAFAASTLSEVDSVAAAERHLRWVIGWAEAADAELRGAHAPALLARLTRDHAETRAALSAALFAGDGEAALRLAGALNWFWYRCGHIAEGLGWLRSALDLAAGAQVRWRGRALLGLAALCYLSGDPAAARDAAFDAATAARACGDTPSEARATIYAGHFTGLLGDPHAGLETARQGQKLAQGIGVPWVHAEGLMVLGMLTRLTGDTGAALSIADSAVAAGEACGHSWATAGAAWTAMKSAMDGGDPGRALELAARVLVPLDAAADITSWLVLAHSTAAALAQVGRAEEAAILYGAVAARGARIGFSPELMDPVDGPREAAAVRSAVPAADLERCLAHGSKLTRAQVNDMIMSGGTATLGNGLERSSK